MEFTMCNIDGVKLVTLYRVMKSEGKGPVKVHKKGCFFFNYMFCEV